VKLTLIFPPIRYIARNDGSPLMHALVVWRDAARQQRVNGEPSRQSSPLSGDEHDRTTSASPPPSAGAHEQPHDRMHHTRSKSEPPEKPLGKPTSSSWVQWWSRSRRDTASTKKNGDGSHGSDGKAPPLRSERPGLRGTASAPLQNVRRFVYSNSP
jgi:phosphatidate phosphatase LPIN